MLFFGVNQKNFQKGNEWRVASGEWFFFGGHRSCTAENFKHIGRCAIQFCQPLEGRAGARPQKFFQHGRNLTLRVVLKILVSVSMPKFCADKLKKL